MTLNPSKTVKRLFLFSIPILALVALLTSVMTTWAVDKDGRLNVVYHLGGDVLYCVDANRTSAASYADGGFLLMSQTGQHLFFVPVADIEAVPERPEANTVIATGSGSYGGVTLWRLSNGMFALTGLDEHGKPYDFQWTGCLPVGEVGFPRTTSRCVTPLETEEPSNYGSYRPSQSEASGTRSDCPEAIPTPTRVPS